MRADGGPEGDVLSFEMDPQTLAIRKKKEMQVTDNQTYVYWQLSILALFLCCQQATPFVVSNLFMVMNHSVKSIFAVRDSSMQSNHSTSHVAVSHRVLIGLLRRLRA